MRVAIVTESFPPVFNGVANSVVRVLETLKAQGHEAIVIAPTTTGKYFNGFRTYRVPSVPIFQFQLGLPNPFVNKILDDFKPDVVHAASPVLLGAQAVAWAQRNYVPSVAIFQTDIAAYTERYGFKALRPFIDRAMANFHAGASINLAPTTEVADYLRRIGLSNVYVWGRGVDLDLYHPNRKASEVVGSLRKQLAPNGERIIGFVGRLAAEKQVDRFSELFSIPNTSFLIVGDGPERMALEQKFQGAKVQFVGKQSGEDLANWYASMDAFVHFGTEETYGQTIQEAQAAGVPVIAPNSGGPKFLIDSGVSGYLVDAEISNGFTPVLSNLLDNPELAARLAEGGRRKVLDKSWEANNAKLLDFYASAIESSVLLDPRRLLVA
ncbi:MAG: glycosyltransferase family 4 protein [Rhodoluna sp.]